MARAPLNPLLLELPLHLAVFGFATALMGLAGSHIHQIGAIVDKMEHQSSYPDFVNLDFHKIRDVDLALLIIAAVQWVFSIFALLMSCEQFKKRRGEYSGKGTGAWIVVGLGQLLLLGAWAGIAGAYTAYAVMKRYTFTPGTGYAEPFDSNHALYLYQINSYIHQQSTESLRVNQAPGATGVDFSLGDWDVSTLGQANAILDKQNYLSVFSWKAAVAVVWFELGTAFLVTVVHFALPFVWKALGLIRQPKKTNADYY